MKIVKYMNEKWKVKIAFVNIILHLKRNVLVSQLGWILVCNVVFAGTLALVTH